MNYNIYLSIFSNWEKKIKNVLDAVKIHHLTRGVLKLKLIVVTC